MPGKKNTKGGKGHRKAKRAPTNESKKIDFKEHGQEYGLILRKLGDGRFEVKCSDGETRIGRVRGKMRKRVWINPNDLVLVSLRQDFTDDKKADIISKYTQSDGRKLIIMGELNIGFLQNGDNEDENNVSDDNIDLDYGGQDEKKTVQSDSVTQQDKKDETGINWDDI